MNISTSALPRSTAKADRGRQRGGADHAGGAFVASGRQQQQARRERQRQAEADLRRPAGCRSAGHQSRTTAGCRHACGPAHRTGWSDRRRCRADGTRSPPVRRGCRGTETARPVRRAGGNSAEIGVVRSADPQRGEQQQAGEQREARQHPPHSIPTRPPKGILRRFENRALISPSSIGRVASAATAPIQFIAFVGLMRSPRISTTMPPTSSCRLPLLLASAISEPGS